MVPAELLGVERHHKVLDMCAAPGSKTTQLLDQMAARGDPSQAAGVVVANDMDHRRCCLLASRLQTIGAAAANGVVVCHKAHLFPNVENEAGEDSLFAAGVYDRIICDVPCSGDGTLRKDPKVWKTWHPMFGNQLHHIQLQIAMRAAALLRVGGLMVYSTCSFNPIEDEAVVDSLLRRTGGALELVDTTGQLPDLVRADGISSWSVTDDNMTVYASLEEVPAEDRHAFAASMWPSSQRPSNPLHRCMRLYPHLSGTGGFFVAVIRKTAELPGPTPRRNKQPSTRLSALRRPDRRSGWAAAGPAAREAAEANGLRTKSLRQIKGRL
eukprot:TRINITY_DN27872_c0_g1_i2.p1 TRINITY_DN27872_c0_g1~~TRINITY_DN27872_c0_g1_i2.p1  ORF type:complete len:325 (+),score=45.74 TRINITY_DN27872_c0_g1_i2:235-1209(+)